MDADQELFIDVRNPTNLQLRLQPFIEAINHESPLPCALVCAAYVDKCLLGIIEASCNKDRVGEKKATKKR